MGNDSYPVLLTQSATTTLKSCLMFGIAINKTLAGTLVINDNGNAVANFAIGTLPGTYHIAAHGVRYAALTAVLSTTDNVTVFIKAQ